MGLMYIKEWQWISGVKKQKHTKLWLEILRRNQKDIQIFLASKSLLGKLRQESLDGQAEQTKCLNTTDP
jgi:hypothetical protein